MNADQYGPFYKLKAYFTSLLPTLNEESWKFCESMLRIKVVKKGELVYREGNVCNYVSFVNHGLARMYYMIDGREKIICFQNENSYISDYRSFLTREPSLSSTIAMEDLELVETSYEDLQLMYKVAPEANILGRLIAENLFITVNQMRADSIKHTIEQNYMKLIDEMPWLLQRVPQYMIASYLGVTPEALSRVKARISKTHRVIPEVY